MKSKDIKEFRKKLKLNTKDFGDLIGVSARTVEGWEQGKKPSGTAIKILNQIFIEKK